MRLVTVLRVIARCSRCVSVSRSRVCRSSSASRYSADCSNEYHAAPTAPSSTGNAQLSSLSLIGILTPFKLIARPHQYHALLRLDIGEAVEH